MLPSSQQLLLRLMMLVPMLLSLTVHEYAHAWSAHRLGDDTAARLGRLTLNPLAHIDLIGTIVLPLMGVPFGWARPVPINPARFTRRFTMSTGMVLTALAGPVSNMVLAVLCTVLYGVTNRWAPQLFLETPAAGLLLRSAILMNVALAVFNLLPVPPLDGSRVVGSLMPLRLRGVWEKFTSLSPFLLMGVFFFSGFLTRGPIRFATQLLDVLLRVIVS